MDKNRPIGIIRGPGKKESEKGSIVDCHCRKVTRLHTTDCICKMNINPGRYVSVTVIRVRDH